MTWHAPSVGSQMAAIVAWRTFGAAEGAQDRCRSVPVHRQLRRQGNDRIDDSRRQRRGLRTDADRQVVIVDGDLEHPGDQEVVE